MTENTRSELRCWSNGRTMYTPGPYSCSYEWDEVQEVWEIRAPGTDEPLLSFYGSGEESEIGESEATAYLLTAAPQLFEALTLLNEYAKKRGGPEYLSSKTHRLVREALRVATDGHQARTTSAHILHQAAEDECSKLTPT